MEQYQAPNGTDFSEILRDGLSSKKTYTVLRQKSRSPVVLQFKPLIHRRSSTVIYLGGKLSAFPDLANQEEKWEALSDDEKVERLKTAWKKLPPDRVSNRRVGSHIGFYVAAGYKDRELFEKKFDTQRTLSALLQSIEKELGVEIEDAKAVKGFLAWFYHANSAHVFSPLYGGRIPDRVVGKRSDVLLGMSFANFGNTAVYETFVEKFGLMEVPENAAAEEEAEEEENEDA